MPWDVLLVEGMDPSDFDSIDDIATFTRAESYPNRKALYADLDRFDAIINATYEIDAEFLDRASNLKVIARRGVGVDNVDLAAATQRGILVCNTPGANARAVAEHAIGLLFAVRRRLVTADSHVRAGAWRENAHVPHELQGDCLGVFGCGDIGQQTASLADGLGLRTIGYDPYVSPAELPSSLSLVSEPRDLFEAADIVSLHTPLTEETHHVVDSTALRQLGGTLINTSRGEVVDETALVTVLEEGVLEGAGLDVFETEPPDADHPLFEFGSVVLTPHIAGTTVEANRAKCDAAAANVRTVHAGRIPDATVNPDATDG